MLRAFCSDWSGDSVIPELSREELHHLIRVRRVRAGEKIEILNGRGSILSCVVKSVAGNNLEFQIDDLSTIPPPPVRVHLLVAMPKGKTFPALLHKAVELGVTEITPLVTENSEVDATRMEGKSGRWESVLVEAVKQSGNPRIPLLHPPKSLTPALQQDTVPSLRLCAALQPDAQPLLSVLEDGCPSAGIVDIFVGPEGDFSDSEYAAMRASDCRFVSLGPLVLKVETAASLVVGTLALFLQNK
jgi:16S rRNA (uracil1498-N3)-methyltransferase